MELLMIPKTIVKCAEKAIILCDDLFLCLSADKQHPSLEGRTSDYTGWPRKNATLTINNFKKTRGRMKSCVHYRIKNSFPSKMTPRTLIWMKAFSFYGRFSDAMSFSRFALLSQKSQFTYRRFSIVWLPRVKCLLFLCKAKPAWIKRSIHYVIVHALYDPGELLKEIPPDLKRDFWYKRSKCWKWHCLGKMALESKRLHQNP